MERHPPSTLQLTALVGILLATVVFFWTFWAPIAWRAIRTGRLLARGVVYDRQVTPKMFWLGLLSVFIVILLVTASTFALTGHLIGRLGLQMTN